MGLTAWKSGEVRKTDVTVAKNFLKEDEIEELNRIVTMWLDFAEDQAKRRKQVFMKDWEYNLVERPFCEQLQKMGWSWTPGDVDVAELTERGSFREVLLKGRLAEALRRINLRDGHPWLDDSRVEKAIRDLERAAGHRLMEINQAATELLLKGTVAEGLPDWDNGRPQPIRYIDFVHHEKNDFLVVNQFKVELTGGRGQVIPDAVLFVIGIPIVVAEFKSPGIESPMHEAINQLFRYSNQRRELFPTLYTDNEGVEKLFHTNQLLIASNFFEARAATIGAPPEAYLEWADTSPVPMSTVAEELGIISASHDLEKASKDFFRQMPNALLANYFQGRGVFGDLNFASMMEGKPAA
jgi:type I restriction enzyme R subunit